MPRIITCAGYYRTGSSAISDFFSEFDDCTSLGDYEFRFLQDPGGISDLEYNLIENNHRHNTSHAIKKFRNMVEFHNGNFYSPRYRKYFGDEWLKCSYAYINSIAPFQTNLWWHVDQIERGAFFYFLDRLYAKAVGIVNSDRSNVSMLTKERAFFSNLTAEEFYMITKEYTRNLFNFANKNSNNFIMVDQLVPPSNIHRYLNYVDDMKVIVVDRDPRDLYVLEKTRYQWGIIPYKNVNDFCKWYEIIHRHINNEIDNPQKVMRINFEEIIYDYDNVKKILCDFIDISYGNHTKQMSFFDPDRSIKNTHLYNKYPELANEITYIENNLNDYLYFKE